MKIGVVYVGQGQEDQNDIFKNEAGSELYEEFVRGLGWMVDLRTHVGYMGGLDRNLTNGKVTPFYATGICPTKASKTFSKH